MSANQLQSQRRRTVRARAFAVPPAGGPVRLGLAVGLLLLAVFAGGWAQAQQRPDSFADLAERLLPTVVNISTSQTIEGRRFRPPELPEFPEGSPFEEFFRDFFDRYQEGEPAPDRRATSLGSGFVVDPSGVIVTNYHVVERADEVTVILADDTRLDATVVGWDEKTDIAVLRVEPDAPLPATLWGDSDAMRVGDWVIAIGNPFGLGGTVTAGIISAFGRDIRQGPYDQFIQTDASINRGNSGGPMFNTEGEVIGINTAIFSPSGGSVGIGFAIPSSLARGVVDQILEFGRTRRGWIGVRIQTVTEEIAESLGLGEPRGAMVTSLTPGGPAEEAGLLPGDVIVEFDRQDIPEMRDLPRLVADTPVNREVDVVVFRRGDIVTLQIRLGELEEAEAAGLLAATPETNGPALPRSLDTVGLTVVPVNQDMREEYDLDAALQGLVVTAIDPDGPAADKDIRVGDVIVEIGQEPVTTYDEAAERIDQAQAAGRRSVLVTLDRQGVTQFTGVSLE